MKRLWWALACALAFDQTLCATALGQIDTLLSRPAGAFLDIQGPTAVSGVGPVPLTALSLGNYRWTARGLGIAMARGRFTHDKDGLRFRSWAGPSAALVPPGMVHLARGEQRGWYYLGAGTFSGVMWWSSNSAVKNADEQVREAQERFDLAIDAGDPTAAAALQPELTTAKDELRDETRIRGIWAGYFGAIWIGAAIETWLLTPRPTVALGESGGYVATFPTASGWATALRSAVVPGSGQRLLGHERRATIFSTTIAASLAGAILTQDAVLTARRDYYAAKRRQDAALDARERLEAQSALAEAESDEDTLITLRSILLGLAAPLYVWNVVDAFIGGHRVEAAAATPPSMAWSVVPATDGLSLSVSWRLP